MRKLFRILETDPKGKTRHRASYGTRGDADYAVSRYEARGTERCTYEIVEVEVEDPIIDSSDPRIRPTEVL